MIGGIFLLLSVYGYKSGGWEGLYLWELIIGGIFFVVYQ